MNLTTPDRVRTLIAASGDNGQKRRESLDAELSAVIATVSAAAEAYMDRHALRTSRTEYHDATPGMRLLRLKGYPVTTLTSVYYDEDQAFAASSLMTSDDYYDVTLDDTGALRFKWPFAYEYPRSIKVVYTGGMATDTDSFIDSYPDIAGAMDMQAAHEWQRRGAMGVSSVNHPDGTTVSMTSDRWIAAVKQVLDYYRRLV